jgi:3-deoxy-manno-octulosonate cytidylyltransferase (CMP-KDO synthetase)
LAPASPTVWAVIPARFAATRLPGKPLVTLVGKPMIQRVWERVKLAKKITKVVVATEDERIRAAVQAFGGEAVMTRSDHRSGTARIAEVAAGSAADIYINVQGDEPLVAPEAVDALVDTITEDANVHLATLAVPLTNPSDIMDTHIVKVVLDFEGDALYFSRVPPGDLERVEQLEQLRWLENGYKMRVAETEFDSVSVDVPDDVPRVEELIRKSAA